MLGRLRAAMRLADSVLPGRRILHTLRVRYTLDMIYTYSGNILIAVRLVHAAGGCFCAVQPAVASSSRGAFAPAQCSLLQPFMHWHPSLWLLRLLMTTFAHTCGQASYQPSYAVSCREPSKASSSPCGSLSNTEQVA